MKPQPACPECEKLSAVAEKSNIIGDFLDWLREKDMAVCAIQETKWDSYEYYPMFSFEKLLATYFEIDLNKVEQERQALLEWLRTRNEEE